MTTEATTIENPITGEHVTFKKRARDTEGALLEFELTLNSRAKGAPKHVHAAQEEHIEVTSGAVLLTLGGEERRLVAGESLSLPAGVAHTLWNDGEEDAVVAVQVKPALDTETGIETLFGLARDGKTNKEGSPNPLQGALLAKEYQTFLAFPSVSMQRVALIVLVPLAKLFGYRARYPDYSRPEVE